MKLPWTRSILNLSMSSYGKPILTTASFHLARSTKAEYRHMATSLRSIALMVDEPDPGSFYWVLLEVRGQSNTFAVLESASRSEPSFDASLSAGARELRRLSGSGSGGPRKDHDAADNPSGWTPL